MRVARLATLWSSPGLAATQRCSSCNAARPAGTASPLRVNCICPPGRLKNITSWLATFMAMSRPRSSSTRASARSSPAVTPGGRAELAVADVDGILVHGDRRDICCASMFCDRPMRRDPPAIKQTGGGQEEGPAAHRAESPGRRSPAAAASRSRIPSAGTSAAFGHPATSKRVDRLLDIAVDDLGRASAGRLRNCGSALAPRPPRPAGDRPDSRPARSPRRTHRAGLRRRAAARLAAPRSQPSLVFGYCMPMSASDPDLSVFDVLRRFQDIRSPDLSVTAIQKLQELANVTKSPQAAVIPDSKLARAITEFVRDTETDAALQPFQPRLSLRRAGRRAPRADVRSASCSTPAPCSTTSA